MSGVWDELRGEGVKRGVRYRRIFKWVGTVACVLFVLSGMACLRWYASVRGANWWISAAGGAIHAAWWSGGAAVSVSPSLETGVAYEHWRDSWQAWSDFGLWPRDRSPAPTIRCVTLPLWIPFVLIAAPTAALWRMERRRARPGHCRKCSY